MATRSNIGILNEDGTVTAIYCHWDGYPEGVGLTLVNHYQDEDRVRELLSLGSISYLTPIIAPPNPNGEITNERVRGILEKFNPTPEHTFDDPIPGITVAYHRDRGEPFEVGTFTSEDVYTKYNNSGWVDYNYLFKNNQWYCGGRTVKKILKIE